MNAQILNRDEKIDILLKENQQLKENLLHQEQNNRSQVQYSEEKLQKLHVEYKTKLKNIKQEIEEQVYNNGNLSIIQKYYRIK